MLLNPGTSVEQWINKAELLTSDKMGKYSLKILLHVHMLTLEEDEAQAHEQRRN